MELFKNFDIKMKHRINGFLYKKDNEIKELKKEIKELKDVAFRNIYFERCVPSCGYISLNRNSEKGNRLYELFNKLQDEVGMFMYIEGKWWFQCPTTWKNGYDIYNSNMTIDELDYLRKQELCFTIERHTKGHHLFMCLADETNMVHNMTEDYYFFNNKEKFIIDDEDLKRYKRNYSHKLIEESNFINDED